MARLLLGGWGRRAAWAVLIVFLALQAGAGWLFETPRIDLFDTYQRALPRTSLHKGVVIVAIDDASLAKVGQWPWPHHVMARLISAIAKGGPLALGIDMIWPEPDRQSPEQWLKNADDIPPALAAALRQLPSHDAQLAGALHAGPVAIGIGGLSDSPLKDDKGPLAAIALSDLDAPAAMQDPPDILPSFGTTLRSIPELDHAAAGHGLLSVTPDPDGTFRRLPMVSRVSGRLAPALSLEMLRLAMPGGESSWLHLYYRQRGIEGVGVGELRIPTQRDGSIWVNFSSHDPSRFLSAADVLSGRVPANAFDHKLVLLGLTGLGQLDQRLTPLDYMPGVEIQAQLLEDILLEQVARRPAWAPGAELALTFLAGLLLIIALPQLRASLQMIVIIIIFLALGGLGFGLWRQPRILLDVATPLIGQAAVVAALLGAGFAQADMQRRRLRLSAARTEGELEAARRIQMGILPNPAGLQGDGRFDLDALMIPARHIGGDLFDFFQIDAGHLFFSVGDVSGKGMPAALFMALGKSLCKSCALHGEPEIGAIINRTNREISRDNPETLFITLFAGILNLATGELRFCNAGHDAPFLLRAGEVPHSLDAQGGPPLCIVDDFDYPEERFQLRPGDMLCVITDGITEAMTKQGDVMGRARSQAVLAALPPDSGPKAAIQAVHDAVEKFVAGAEASDDLTILAVRWNGPIAQ
ncbi:MAG TPA: CHASE2 domain-containing protein [Rhizomicrobium sp.]|nr:CHASE2 domain-containing protein [Rhizomicrobium sp.]